MNKSAIILRICSRCFVGIWAEGDRIPGGSTVLGTDFNYMDNIVAEIQPALPIRRSESPESRIIKRRALEGHHPTSPDQITAWLEAAAKGWNADPTPFEWGGKRQSRRQRSRARRYQLSGSSACTRRPLRYRKSTYQQWQS